ncbi:amidohydrolase family protein [Salinimicrobium soli]|uniref:amidohydrolase family protein n=1 Tax=Salinimicrobium soli TaxID=1254399 RepID=UPI003AAE721C
MTIKNTLFGTLIILLLASSCKENSKQEVDLLITNASVLDLETGTTTGGRLIAISGDTIREVADMENRDQFEAPEVYDASDQIVMPGLWDMHVHFRGGDTLIQENKELLPLFLAHGITTVRDAGGDITPSVLEWREQIEKGELAGPDIFTSGPKLDGANPAWPGSIVVADSSDIEKALDSLEALNVDYVKMYDGSISKEMFYGIIKAAEQRGMKTSGHMPLAANILEAAEYGLDGSEHLYYVLKSCSPKADSLTQVDPGYGMMSEILATYDPELARQVFDQLQKENVFITPTLFIGKTLSEILEVDHSQDTLLQYVSSGIQETYRGRIESAKRARDAGSTMRQEMEKRSMQVIKPMYDAGIPLLAGSDTGPFNSFVYPGSSLLGELEMLVEAGLTPQEALRTSVINGPLFFDLEDFYGSIAPGKMAHLLILEKDPLKDIKNLRVPVAVIKNGKVYDHKKIQEMINN